MFLVSAQDTIFFYYSINIIKSYKVIPFATPILNKLAICCHLSVVRSVLRRLVCVGIADLDILIPPSKLAKPLSITEPLLVTLFIPIARPMNKLQWLTYPIPRRCFSHPPSLSLVIAALPIKPLKPLEWLSNMNHPVLIIITVV